MSSKSGKARLFREVIKDQQTTHWDLDLLSWEELEQVLHRKQDASAGSADSEQPHAELKPKPTSSRG